MNGLLRQTGYTMLEMLVSIAVGIIIALAATQLFVTNQMSFNLQKGIGDVSDNGRFALEFMGRAIRAGSMQPMSSAASASNTVGLAGAQWPVVIVDKSDIPSGVSLPNNVLSQDNLSALAAPATGKQGGIGPSDSLLVQYFTLFDTRDCEGQAVPGGNYVLARFFLRPDTTAGTGSALACEGGYYSGLSGSALTNFSATDTGGTVMLSSVDNFQVLIGVANTALSNVPQQYLTIPAYKALAPRPPIAAVRMGLLVSSVERAGTLIGASPSVTVLNQAIASSSVPVDNRVRRVFSSTIAMRNTLN